MCVEAKAGSLEVECRLHAGIHRPLVGPLCGKVPLADVLRTIETTAGQAVEDVGQKGALLEGGVHDARVIFDQDLLAGFLVLVTHARVVGLWREAHGLLVEAKTEPVTAQLLGRVVVQQLQGHGRLDRTGARGLLAHEQHVVVGDGRVLKEVPSERLPDRRLRDTVEVDVVLANELVDLGVICAPPVLPVTTRVATLL